MSSSTVSVVRRSALAASLIVATGMASAPALAASASATPLSSAQVATAEAAGVKSITISTTSAPSNIKALQHLLTAYGFSATADGSYGPATTAAVKSFQTKYGLTADGSAGPNTMAKMVGGTNVAVKENWPNTNTAKAAQQLLIKNGFITGTADGTFSATDVQAVKTAQTKYELPVTGVVDHATWSWLFHPPVPPTKRTGPAMDLYQYETGTGSEDHDCGPAALVTIQLRIGRTPAKWTDWANRGDAIDYARETVLGMTNDGRGTSQINDATGVLAGWKKLGISGAASGNAAAAASAVRAGGVAMLLGAMSEARTWQGKTGGVGIWHWVALVDYDASTGKYQIADSSHRANELVWVTETDLKQYEITSETSGVFAK